jgi:segregation and condensation protein A
MFRIQLQQFEGPLDLLLFFIRRDELDIYDIPIASIADEFLEYVRVLEQVDLDGVGDFLYMAALLIHIKARMLLPKPELDEDGEPIDPRQELVERLLQYVRFKEAALHLESQQDERARQFTRSNPAGEYEGKEAENVLEGEASVFDLISALRRVLTEAPAEVNYEIHTENYTVEEQSIFVMSRLPPQDKMSFSHLVERNSKPFIIATFLAVLELARLGRILILVGSDADDFYLEQTTATASEALPSNGSNGVL